jgi:ABC-type sugar transport system ATPase subunit
MHEVSRASGQQRLNAVLKARGIVKRFPGVIALKGVDFDLLPGEVHALLGENGAGKSTLVNILTGVLPPDEGELSVGDAPVEFDSPRDARAAGIHAIHQELSFVPQLDIATNLALGNLPLRSGWISRALGLIDRKELHRRARRALATTGGRLELTNAASKLSVAQAQILEITRALDGDFRVILFDEPTSSLGPAERNELFAQIRRLRETRIGIVYISHRLEEVLELADYITVLRDGSVAATGPVSGFDNSRIVELITGKALTRAQPVAREIGAVSLEVSKLSSPPQVAEVDLVLRRGEIVGLTGLVGAGRTELAECLYGARSITSGTIKIDGKLVAPSSPAEALRLGIGYATEDRKDSGIFHRLGIDLNIAISAFCRPNIAPRYLRFRSLLRVQELRAVASELAASVGIRPRQIRTPAGTLSGGNQQKVMLARLVAAQLRILVLDEPTRGVDVGAKDQIWALLQRLAENGLPLLVISSDIPELLGRVDRVLVMRRSRIVAELVGDEISEAGIMRHAL